MRRLAAVLMLILVPICCSAVGVVEYGLRVTLDRLGARFSNPGRWHAIVEVYVQSEVDEAWRMESALGLDFANYSPYASVGLLRSMFVDMDLEGDLALQWIPRQGIAGTVDTGFRYHPRLSESCRLIVETYPIQWRFVSIDHRYSLRPVFNPTMTVGALMLLEQGGFFGEAVTLAGIRGHGVKPAFSLFVGNDWYLAAGQMTTRIGFRP